MAFVKVINVDDLNSPCETVIDIDQITSVSFKPNKISHTSVKYCVEVTLGNCIFLLFSSEYIDTSAALSYDQLSDADKHKYDETYGFYERFMSAVTIHKNERSNAVYDVYGVVGNMVNRDRPAESIIDISKI
jgi:hypothetical protein